MCHSKLGNWKFMRPNYWILPYLLWKKINDGLCWLTLISHRVTNEIYELELWVRLPPDNSSFKSHHGSRESPCLILMETKNQEEMVRRVQHRLKFQHYFLVNPVGLARGLVLFWNDLEPISIKQMYEKLYRTAMHSGGD